MKLLPPGAAAALFAAGLALSPFASRAADAAGAERFIAALGDEVVSTLQRPDLTLEEAETQFRGVFRTNFDIPTIGQFSLGRYWRVASPTEREEFLLLFEEMIVETYARRFTEYSGQSFRVTGSREISERDVLVSTSIINADGQLVVVIDWRVRQRETGYQIIDVVVEQVSMGVTQRSDFNAVIQRGGGKVEVLLQALREQVQTAQQDG
ncbi:MAG: ABC transporter substrate-binding protein [Inquilinus sp.]|nr:ABC transporter substrate-binding protein [Inquilinus sp.]